MDIDNFEKEQDNDGRGKEFDPSQYSPLALAYVGDAVYELAVRTIVAYEANTSANKLNKKGKSYVNAGAQSSIIKLIMDNLSDEELAVFKRGRNAKSNTRAKNATLTDYKAATGFEALVGWLYMGGRGKRAIELITTGIILYRNENNENAE